MGKPLARSSFANVVSVISLLFALGLGSAWAVTELSKNEVTSKHIKNKAVKGKDLADNAVGSDEVADGSLLGADFAADQLPTGEPGPPGPEGPQGAAGRSALEPLRSGETIRGVVGADDHAPAVGDFGVIETFPIPAPEAVPGTKVDVDGSADEVGNRCTGAPSAPTAPPGIVCIYASDVANAASLSGGGAPDITAGSPYGFRLIWGASAIGDTLVYASWAYQAP